MSDHETRLMRFLLLGITAFFISSCSCEKQSEPARCTQDTYLDDPTCTCWCSQKCGYREKTKRDHPLYVENDPNGKFCYCKQWDLDYYDENCLEGQDVKQPPHAE